ncbi:MAG: hypothetical protein U9R34_08625 [Nanoarchaeota archaeon]|nr:hypothetical protein [Nanoarchaeota archaeon]
MAMSKYQKRKTYKAIEENLIDLRNFLDEYDKMSNLHTYDSIVHSYIYNIHDDFKPDVSRLNGNRLYLEDLLSKTLPTHIQKSATDLRYRIDQYISQYAKTEKEKVNTRCEYKTPKTLMDIEKADSRQEKGRFRKRNKSLEEGDITYLKNFKLNHVGDGYLSRSKEKYFFLNQEFFQEPEDGHYQIKYVNPEQPHLMIVSKYKNL